MRVKLAGGLLVHHFVDPDDAWPLSFCALHCDLHFLSHARRVRRGGAKDNLKVAIHKLDCTHKMLESLLASDSADEKNIWLVWINVVPLERGTCLHLSILVQIDPIVDHVNPRGIDTEQQL